MAADACSSVSGVGDIGEGNSCSEGERIPLRLRKSGEWKCMCARVNAVVDRSSSRRSEEAARPPSLLIERMEGGATPDSAAPEPPAADLPAAEMAVSSLGSLPSNACWIWSNATC